MNTPQNAIVSNLNQSVVVADHKYVIGKHTEANSLYAMYKKDAFTTNIGMLKLFNQRKLMNTPLLLMTDAKKNTMYLNGPEGKLRYNIPYELDLPMVAEDLTTGIDKPGIGNTKFKLGLNMDCFTNTDIITTDLRDGIPLYITEDEIYKQGTVTVYTVMIPIRNRPELYYDKSLLQPGTQYMKITNANGEFDTQKSSITDGTGSLSLELQMGGHRSVYHWITGYAHMMKVTDKDGIANPNYSYLNGYGDMNSDKATMNIFNLDKDGKPVPGSLSWIRYIDAKLMAEIKMMEEKDLWWNKGGLVQGAGKKMVPINTGLHMQMKAGNYAQYTTLTLGFIEALLTRLYYNTDIPIELRRAEFQVGPAAMIEISKLLADDFRESNPFVVNAESLKNMIYGKDAMNLGYGFRFTSKRFPTAGEVTFTINSAFAERVNRNQDGLFGEFPKLAYTIAIFDITASAATNMAGNATTKYRVEGADESANIMLLKPEGWGNTTWGYEIGTIHPFGEASSQGMYSGGGGQRHGFGMWAQNMSAIWLKDSSRTILLEKA